MTKETTEAIACAALLRRKVDKADTVTVDRFIGLASVSSRDDAAVQIETVEAAMGRVADLLESMAGKLETVQRAIEIWSSNASICRGSETQELGFLTGKAQAYETAARELGVILESQ